MLIPISHITEPTPFGVVAASTSIQRNAGMYGRSLIGEAGVQTMTLAPLFDTYSIGTTSLAMTEDTT